MQTVLNLVAAALVLALVIGRQLRPKEVREVSPYRLVLVLGIIGVLQQRSFVEGSAARPPPGGCCSPAVPSAWPWVRCAVPRCAYGATTAAC